MTQRNIYAMDIIVTKLAEGKKISKALKEVYSKRNVCIPYNKDEMNVEVTSLKMNARATNPLLRTRLKTIGDVVNFCYDNKITDITNFGKASGIELFETILDYFWDRMTEKEKTAFLIDTVERNSENICIEIA